MNDTSAPLTPKAKLAASRAELLGAMGFREVADTSADGAGEPRAFRLVQDKEPPVKVNSLTRWWRRQPAMLAYELLEPGLHRYARRHPQRLVAYAAATGGLLVMLRPWRLFSVSAGVALAFKAIDIIDLASVFLDKRGRDHDAGLLLPATRQGD